MIEAIVLEEQKCQSVTKDTNCSFAILSVLCACESKSNKGSMPSCPVGTLFPSQSCFQQPKME